MRRLLAVVTTLALLSSVARADEDERKLARKVMTAGAVVLGVGWNVSIGETIAAYATHGIGAPEHEIPPVDPFVNWNLLPVIGPFILAAREGNQSDARRALGYSDAAIAGPIAMYAVPGVVQLVGFGILVGGAVYYRRASKTRVSAQPLPGGAALMVSGTF